MDFQCNIKLIKPECLLQPDEPPTVYEFRYGDFAGTFSASLGTKYTQGFSFAADAKTSIEDQTAYLVLQNNNKYGTLVGMCIYVRNGCTMIALVAHPLYDFVLLRPSSLAFAYSNHFGKHVLVHDFRRNGIFAWKVFDQVYIASASRQLDHAMNLRKQFTVRCSKKLFFAGYGLQS